MNKYSPSCQCCEEPFDCALGDGDVDGRTCNVGTASGTATASGTGTVGGWVRNNSAWSGFLPNHTTHDSNSLWYDNVTVNHSGLPWKFTCEHFLDVEPTEVTPGVFKDYGHAEVGIVAALTDCSNYALLRFTQHRPTTGLSYIMLELAIVIDGVEEVLAVHTLNSQSCYDKSNGGGAGGTDVDIGWGFVQGNQLFIEDTRLTLCWDGITLTGEISPVYDGGDLNQVEHGSKLRLASYKLADGTPLNTIIPTSGLMVGLITGDLSTEITEVIFKELEYEIAEAQDSEGVNCEQCQPHCCGARVPVTAILEVSGVASGNSATGNCKIECNLLNGTYIMQRSMDSIVETNPCNSDAVCAWVDLTSISGLCFDVFPVTVRRVAGIGVEGHLSMGTTGILTRSISGNIDVLDLGSTLLARYSSNDFEDESCDMWTDWITLNLDLSIGCNFSSATVKAKLQLT